MRIKLTKISPSASELKIVKSPVPLADPFFFFFFFFLSTR